MKTLPFAWRALGRAPVFTGAAVLTLAIGIGATTATFTVLDTILLKPLQYRDPDRLAGVWVALPGMGFDAAPQSTSSYFTFRRLSHTIEGMGVVDRASSNLEIGDAGRPERIRSALVSASVFTLLGPTFERGRGFTAAEDAPHGGHVAILSDALWRNRLGADPNVVGKTIRIDGVPTTVVGVVSPRFAFPDALTQLWQPIALDSATSFGGPFAHQAFVRLKPGVTIDQMRRELEGLMPRIAELYPNIAPSYPTQAFLTSVHASVVVHPMRDDIVGNFGNVALIASVAALLLLVTAVANVASLLLTRAEARQRELAVRVALGAGPIRVIGQFLGESLWLAAMGGVLGMALAWTGLRVFVRAGPPGIPRLAEMRVDGQVLGFALAVTALMGLVCSLVPAIRYDTRRLAARLRDGARGGTTGRDRQRARRSLVVSQVAFATVLVAGAGMMLRSFVRLRAVQPGFDARHALTMWLSLPPASYRTDEEVVRFTTRLIDRVQSVPGVSAVGVSSKIPFNATGINMAPVYSDADVDATNKMPPSAEPITATAGYFTAMGIPLVAGRPFDRPDRQNPDEVIIDRTTAAQRWGDSTGASAIGRHVWFSPDQKLTVIGVVGAIHDTSLAAPPGSFVFVPDVAVADTNKSFVTRTLGLVVRTTGDPRSLTAPVERAISDVDRSLPPFGVAAMSDVVEQSITRLTFVMTIIGVTAVLALILAGIGLYGVLAYIVTLRSREISVRLAMGALPEQVAGLVTRQGATLAAAGVVVGIVAFLASARLLRAAVNGVSRPDALTIAGVTAALMLIAILASWIPARRASRVDPAVALSGE